MIMTKNYSNDSNNGYLAAAAAAQSCNVYANAMNAAAHHTSQQHSIDMILGAQRLLQNEFEKTLSEGFLPMQHVLAMNNSHHHHHHRNSYQSAHDKPLKYKNGTSIFFIY